MGDRSRSEEAYVLGMVDRLLGQPGQRGYRFDWLRGDAPGTGRGRTLPVDAYWPDLRLVVEVYERQHDHPVEFFDKSGTATVSGVARGEQRRIYDQRRRDLVPAHDLSLLIVRTAQLTADGRGRLTRDPARDERILRPLLRAAIGGPGALYESPASPGAPA